MPECQEQLLVQEKEFYAANKDEFVRQYPGRYLLIKERELIGNYATANEAIGEGSRHYGVGPFLVRLSGQDAPVVSSPALALGLLCQ